MKSRNFSTSYNLLAKLINKVIYFLTNCFTFLMKFWMLQVRKSNFCGISAIFFWCGFMSEIQVLMTASNFGLFFFLGIISWNGALLFNGRDFIFKWEDGGYQLWIMGKNHGIGGEPTYPLLRETLAYRYYFGRCSSELAQLVPLPYSQRSSTDCSDRLHHSV